MTADTWKHGETRTVNVATPQDVDDIRKSLLKQGINTIQIGDIIDEKVVLKRPSPSRSGVSYAESVLSERI
jgi:hypothetical protein